VKSETKTCQNCKKDFIIEPDDFSFYEKIKVPPPTFCPECRMIRRMSFRNERTIYKRKCNLCNKDIVSIYRPDSPFIVYCYECFYGDNWDYSKYGVDYDFDKSFLKQFSDLILSTPKLANQASNNLVNSEYTNHVESLKNCYLLFASRNNEECMYCTHVNYSKNLMDCYRVSKSELCYQCVDCDNGYNLKYSIQSQSCVDSWFLFNCRGCTDCFLSSNLINKSYCINNEQCTKEQYQDFMKELLTGNHQTVIDFLDKFNILKMNTIRKSSEGVNNIFSSGNYLKNTKNCKNCFDISDSEDCKFLGYCNNAKDVMDGYAIYPTTEFSYEVVGAGVNAFGNLFSYLPWEGALNLVYCINAFPDCKNCFGCTQIRHKQYCILNKQYTKKEYEELVPKIIKHMNDMPYVDSRGIVYKYGEFFPSELSPFYYNETIAQEYFSLKKEQAISQGHKWKEKEDRNYSIDIQNKDIPYDIKDVKDNILGKVIECAHKGECNQQCTEAFRIIPEELQFYKRMNLLLPRLCSNCRHYERLLEMNPMKLWKRECMCNKTSHSHKGKCTVEFETSYAPERPEIVYCERCYQQEVY